MTCPVEPKTKGSLVKTAEDWIVGVTLSFLNTCTLLQLNMLDAIELLNAVLLQSPDEQIVSVDDMRLQRTAGDELKPFPVWTIASVVGRQPKLKAKLLEPSVRDLIGKKYKVIFRRPRLL
jgi:BarA-like signal transduction histidine kinase